MNWYVLGFMFSPDRKRVALIRKTHPEWQAGKWNGIGGHIEVGEDTIEAMIREFREETGVECLDWKIVCHLHRCNDFNCAVYVTLSDQIDSVKTCTEEEVRIFTLPLECETISNLAWLIPLCLDQNDGMEPYRVDYGVPGGVYARY
jgi:8-oxo-dGTP diphosphatase